MRGCLRTVGCLAVLLVIACVAAWFSRDWWLPIVGLRSSREVTAATWETPNAKGAGRADDALIQLESPRGAAFANVSPGDLLAYMEQSMGKAMPKSIDSIQASVVGDRLYLRFRIDANAVDKDKAGALGQLGKHQHVVMGGTLHVIRPGLTELQVKDLSVEGLRLPHAAVPAMLGQFASNRPEGVASDGVAIATPKYIGDVRIANGRLTVYKAAPSKK